MIGICIVVCIFILGTGGTMAYFSFQDDCIKMGVISLLITILLTIGSIIGTIWYYNNTESGKRAIKDWKSEVDEGITRVVIVYDINGNELARYEGKFDVSYDSERIKFDDEKGKRHIIYYTTGTIIIDEK